MVGRILVRGLLRPDMWSPGLNLTMDAAYSTLDLDRARPSHTPRKPGSGLTSPSRPIWPTCRAVAESERRISATWGHGHGDGTFRLTRPDGSNFDIDYHTNRLCDRRAGVVRDRHAGAAWPNGPQTRAGHIYGWIVAFSRVRDLTVPVLPRGGSFAWPMPGCAVRRGSSRRLDGGAGQETNGKLDGVCIQEPLVVRQ